MKRWLLVLAVAPFLHAAGAAEEWKSEEFKCAVTPPSGAQWERVSSHGPSTKLKMTKADHSASVFLSIGVPEGGAAELTDEFVQKWETGLLRAGKMTKTSGQRRKLQGVPAYEMTSTLTVGERPHQMVMILLLADGKLYTLTALKNAAPPLDDPEIQAFIASFRFLQ